MSCNFLYQITADSRTPDQGATTPRSLFSVSSTEFDPPPPRKKFLGTPLLVGDINAFQVHSISTFSVHEHRGVMFLRNNFRSVAVTTDPHLAPRLKMGSAISLLPFQVLMACSRANSYLMFSRNLATHLPDYMVS